MHKLVSPYGGRLINLVIPYSQRSLLFDEAKYFTSIQLSHRSLCDLELLGIGAFSPLTTFMNEANYKSVINNMRLINGTLFPIPITLPVSDISGLKVGSSVTLRSPKNEILAIMKIQEIYQRDNDLEARMVCGKFWKQHPLTIEMQTWGKYCLSGELKILNLQNHHDFREFRKTPRQLRQVLEKLPTHNVVAFQSRNPIHRGHEVLIKKALVKSEGLLLLQPIIGVTKYDDIDYYTRVRILKLLFEKEIKDHKVIINLLPLAMRLTGPREALLNAIIHRNYGANHFIVGRDHASPGKTATGQSFYPADAAQKMLVKYEKELGIKLILMDEIVYLKKNKKFVEKKMLPKDEKYLSISGAKIRNHYLAKGLQIPHWAVRPKIANILRTVYKPRYQQGICIWFTGLPSSGKSTIAEVLSIKLMEYGRNPTLLDGDIVRTHLSKGLGFGKQDRITNILKVTVFGLTNQVCQSKNQSNNFKIILLPGRVFLFGGKNTFWQFLDRMRLYLVKKYLDPFPKVKNPLMIINEMTLVKLNQFVLTKLKKFHKKYILFLLYLRKFAFFRAIRQINFIFFKLLPKRTFLFISTKKTRGFDIYHANDFDTLPAAFLLAKFSHAKLVYDAHEIWPHQQPGQSRACIRLIEYVEAFLMRRVDVAYTVNDHIAGHFYHQYRLAKKPEVILNCPRYKRILAKKFQTERKTLLRKFGLPEKSLLVLYQGKFAVQRGVEHLILASKHTPVNIKVIIRGPKNDYFPKLVKYARRHRVLNSKVFFDEPALPSDLVLKAGGADIGMINFIPLSLNNYYILPNKIFECMAAGLAIVASDLPALREVVNETKCGSLLDKPDWRNIVKILKYYNEHRTELERHGQNALSAVRIKYNWQHEEKKLINIYNNLHQKS